MKVVRQATAIEDSAFLDEVCSLPGGECVLWCVQCGMCAGSCPNAVWMDHSPRKIIALIRAGRREEVLNSNSMGYCASCYLCTVRCPRGVKVTELMHVMEMVANRDGHAPHRTYSVAMHRAFVEDIRRNGRIHEPTLMRRFYLRTNPFAALRMLPVGLKMIQHGRLPFRGEKVEGAKQLQSIVEKARAAGGAR